MQIDYFKDTYPTQSQIYNYARENDPSEYPDLFSYGTSPFGLEVAVEYFTDLSGSVLQQMSYDTLRDKLYSNIIPMPILKPSGSATLHFVVYTGWWKPWYWFDYAYYNDPDPDVGGKDKSLREGTFVNYWTDGWNVIWSSRTALLVSN
jgi:hypothetical protein